MWWFLSLSLSLSLVRRVFPLQIYLYRGVLTLLSLASGESTNTSTTVMTTWSRGAQDVKVKESSMLQLIFSGNGMRLSTSRLTFFVDCRQYHCLCFLRNCVLLWSEQRHCTVSLFPYAPPHPFSHINRISK